MKGRNFFIFRNNNCYLLVLVVFMVFATIPLKVSAGEISIVPQKKNVLIINSYSPNSLAIDSQLSGITQHLGKDTNIQIEYIDSGNFKEPENEKNFYNLLKYKVDKYKKFDLVILADDYAINFGQKYRDTLFKDIPILFYGANNTEIANEFVKKDKVYGVVEEVPIKQNLEIISKFHSGKNVVAVIYEDSLSSKDLSTFYDLESEFKNLNFSHIAFGDMSTNEFKDELLKLDEDDVLLSIYCYKDDNTGFKDMLNTSEVIESLDVPKYNTLDFLLNDKFIGGYVLSSTRTGDFVGKVGKEIVDGKKIDKKLIFTNEIYQYSFYYPQLIKHGILEKELPKGSQIFNKEASFLEKYKEIIIPASFIIILLLITIIILILNVNKRIIYEREIIKAKDAAENTAKIQSDFICNISHELRTPIAVIMSSNQLLDYKIKNCMPIEDNSNVKIIQQNCYRLLRLVNNVIDVARVDSGFMNLRLANVEIISLLENLVLSIIPYAKNRNIEVVFDTDDEEIYMSVDPDKIERIVLNLLSNAIKFSKENGVIHANVTRQKDTLFFSIEDNGVGIDSENLQKIFNKFSQVEDTMIRKNEGSGIGLSLVKSFVNLHGGSIYVDSELGIGSTFVIELPIKLLDDENIYTYSMDPNDSDMLTTNIELSDIFL